MAKFRMSLADRFYDMGSVRLAPNELLGILEMGDGIDPDRVRRAMNEGLILLEEIEQPPPQPAKRMGKKQRLEVPDGISN